jgi:hypothetical protein
MIPTMTETREAKVKEGQFGYPSHFVDRMTKSEKPWNLRYIKAIDNEHNKGTGNYAFRNRAAEYEEWRQYAKGNQPIDKYKVLLSGKGQDKVKRKTKGKDDLSFKVLDWTILGVAKKFTDLLVGKLLQQNNNVGVKAVDPKAVNQRKIKKIQMQEYMINQQFLREVSTRTGIQFETPIDDGSMPPPENEQELSMYMDMFYKEDYCMDLMDMLKLLNEQDNMPQILHDIAYDLVEIGIGVTKAYRVGRRIKRRRCVPERMVTNACRTNDFSDFQHGGEYWDLTIGELREIAGDQFTEAEYQDIANNATGNSFRGVNVTEYFDKNMCYPYDHIRITVLDAVWFSPDQETHQIKVNRFGNTVVYEKDDYWMSDISVEEFNKRNEGKIVRQTINNLYQGMWIVGTDYIFNHGLSHDMLRNESNIGTCIGPYAIYTYRNDSLTRILKPLYDNIQLNWLKYQHFINKSRPSGVDIEYTALQDISIGGSGGQKMTPKEILELYFDTGILLWRRRDWSGQGNQWKPINELQGGISPAAKDHLNFILSDIDLIRQLAGVNELVDASTPGPETGVGVAQIAASASRDAIRYLYRGFDELNIATQRRTVMHINAMAVNGLAPDYTESLGLDTMFRIGALSAIGAHEYGIYLEREPTEEMRSRLALYVQDSIKAGFLLPEEAFEVENEPNIYKAVKLLKLYRKQKEKASQAAMQAQYQAELQKNIESAQATSQAKIQEKQAEYQFKGQYEVARAQAKILENRETVRDQILLAKIQQGHELSMEEQERATKLMVEDTKGQWQLLIANVNAEAAEKKAAQQAKSKPALKKK